MRRRHVHEEQIACMRAHASCRTRCSRAAARARRRTQARARPHRGQLPAAAQAGMLRCTPAHLAGRQRVLGPGQVAQRDQQRLPVQELKCGQHLAQVTLGPHKHLQGGTPPGRVCWQGGTRGGRHGVAGQLYRRGVRHRGSNSDAGMQRRHTRCKAHARAPAAPRQSWAQPGRTHSLRASAQRQSRGRSNRGAAAQVRAAGCQPWQAHRGVAAAPLQHGGQLGREQAYHVAGAAVGRQASDAYDAPSKASANLAPTRQRARRAVDGHRRDEAQGALAADE